MEGAVGAFRAAAGEVRRAHQTAGLRLYLAQDAWYGQPPFRLRQLAAAEVADGLEVHSAHAGGVLQREAENVAYLVHVHARSEGGNQHHRQSGLAAARYGAPLHLEQGTAAKRRVRLIPQPVELQKRAGDAR